MGQLQGLHTSFPGRMRGVLGPQPPQPGKSCSDVLHLQPLSVSVIGEMVQMVSKKLRSPWDTPADWGFILKLVGLQTPSPNTAPPPPSTVLSPPSPDSHLTGGPALTLPAHRVRPCAHNHARGSLVGTHSGTHRPRHTHTGLRSGRGAAWYRCVHLQRRPGGLWDSPSHVTPRPAQAPPRALWGWLILVPTWAENKTEFGVRRCLALALSVCLNVPLGKLYLICGS